MQMYYTLCTSATHYILNSRARVSLRNSAQKLRISQTVRAYSRMSFNGLKPLVFKTQPMQMQVFVSM